MVTEKRIKEIIKEEYQNLQKEAEQQVSREEELREVILQIFFDKDIHVSDLMTDIRIQTGINTVYQYTATKTSKLGKKVVTLQLSYDPAPTSNDQYVEKIISQIKSLSGVKIIRKLDIKQAKLAKLMADKKRLSAPGSKLGSPNQLK